MSIAELRSELRVLEAFRDVGRAKVLRSMLDMTKRRSSAMTTVPEDRLDVDWQDYEGVIGYDLIEHKHTLQLNRHIHWFDTKEEAEEYLVTH